MWRKFVLGLVLLLLGACVSAQTTQERLAVTEIAVTEAAAQVKALKLQGVLVRDAAIYADTALREASDALDAAWLALGKGDEATAVTMLSLAQAANMRLIEYLKRKEKSGEPNRHDQIRKRTGYLAGCGPSIRSYADAVHCHEGEGRGRGQDDLHRGGAGRASIGSSGSGSGSYRYAA